MFTRMPQKIDFLCANVTHFVREQRGQLRCIPCGNLAATRRPLVAPLRLCVVVLSLVALATSPLCAQPWRSAMLDYAWSFPQDHWARTGYKTEWWYFTGHLQTETGRQFGYQFTFFRVGLLPQTPDLDSEWTARDLIMGHAAISDLDRERHYFSDVLHRAAPLLGGFGAFPDTTIAWTRGPAGAEALWTLRWNGAAFDFSMADRAQGLSFELRTEPVKPLVFQGPNGYSEKGAGASQYYSFTRLATSGSITVEEERFAVSGESWMDKEFGSDVLGEHQAGWDWFSLQLDNEQEIMLYILRNRAGDIDFARGTKVSPGGEAQYLTRKDFAIQVTATWISPHTGAPYPAGWAITIGGETWNVRPRMPDQENRARRISTLFYWEGAVAVFNAAGRQIGRGYVELTGYGEGSRPGI